MERKYELLQAAIMELDNFTVRGIPAVMAIGRVYEKLTELERCLRDEDRGNPEENSEE